MKKLFEKLQPQHWISIFGIFMSFFAMLTTCLINNKEAKKRKLQVDEKTSRQFAKDLIEEYQDSIEKRTRKEQRTTAV